MAAPKAPKAYVGMSGGVDSSVSAALLKEQGYDVTGVFIKVWQPDWIECTWREDRRDAMRVCAQLNIPFVTLDLGKEYKKEVVDYMIREYSLGLTPNPDIMCNKYVKFGGFFDWALAQGADHIATGHYARVEKLRATDGDETSQKAYALKAGIDSSKDQSYFLWTLTQRHLSKTLFPVGTLEKTEVRMLAKKFGLSNAEKKDSQGICFIGKIDVKDFVSHYVKSESGIVLDESGKRIGTHDGALLLTLGERHGFTITTQTPQSEPYYITSKDIEKNTITVSHKAINQTEGETTRVELLNPNWTLGHAPDSAKEFFARARYRQKLEPVMVSGDVVTFKTSQPYIASGQSIVIYDGDICIGGGIIGTIRS